MPANLQETFAVDTFQKALGDRRLQQFLLNSAAEDLSQTITAADEWLQIGGAGKEKTQVYAVQTASGSQATNQDDRLDKILTAITGLAELVKAQGD